MSGLVRLIILLLLSFLYTFCFIVFIKCLNLNQRSLIPDTVTTPIKKSGLRHVSSKFLKFCAVARNKPPKRTGQV